MSLIGRLLGRQKGRWPELWQTYPGTVGAAAAVWTVDLGAVDAAPVGALPVRLDVTVRYDAGADGLPAGPLIEVEDRVSTAVDSLGGVYVGRVAFAGACRLTFALAGTPSTEVSIPGLPDAQVQVEYDPHWAYVRDTLAPDARQHRLLADRDVLGVLASAGDQHAIARDVSHLAFFASEEPAEQAAAELGADGFTAGFEPDGEGGVALVLMRRDPVAPPAVHELSWAVQEAVERHGGTYDGWSCSIAA